MNSSDLKTMIADYMETGFLENIIDMFKRDPSLYPLIGELMIDERVRVRLGMSALVETLKTEDYENIQKAVPNIISLLKNKEAVIRADAAYLLGIIGNEEALAALQEMADTEENTEVKNIAKEALEDIKKQS